jgi:uncharacterized protein
MAGTGVHPTVSLLHGFPGNERNLDLAQAIRPSGWNVLFFDYRGSWGTSGAFTFAHTMEETTTAIAYLRDSANATRLHIDPANSGCGRVDRSSELASQRVSGGC